MPWFTPASAMINVLSRKPEKRYSAQQKDGFFFPIYHSPRSADLSPPPVHMGPPPPYYRLYPPTMPQSQAVQEHRRSYSPPAELPPPPPPQPQQKQLMAPPPPPAPAPIIPAPPAPAPERRAISPPRHSVPPTPVPHVLRRRSSSIESLREDVSPVASPRRTLSRRHTLTTAPSALFESGPLSGPVPSIAIFPPTAGAARAVRFTENLICASPPPKRVGWFNRRGGEQIFLLSLAHVLRRLPDQLWTVRLPGYELRDSRLTQLRTTVDSSKRVVATSTRRIWTATLSRAQAGKTSRECASTPATARSRRRHYDPR